MAAKIDFKRLAVRPALPMLPRMEFGWWQKDAEGVKHQVCVEVFGKNITWTCKYGRNSSWQPYGPLTDADWDKLIAEAERRVPRRLFSQKQFEFILSQRPKD